ncbi:MAG TPA: FAD/NAD(P)-binding protein [Candidatus Dormibacteraeota bacterium]|nr:FAD/NAD(P)-binding protein [Candidatus Dormibacteraeota bacterium]
MSVVTEFKEGDAALVQRGPARRLQAGKRPGVRSRKLAGGAASAPDRSGQPAAAVAASVRTTEVAIVGLGSWGLCVLESLIGAARERLPSGKLLRVHVIEPAAPGSGVYAVDQPDYLIMNTPCGEISLYPWEENASGHGYGMGFYEWLIHRGYRWEGDACRVGGRGPEISKHDFLPRSTMGEYLQWFYRQLVQDAPPNAEVVHHASAAVDVVAQPDGTERVFLASGQTVHADHVVLTSGHTANEDPPIQDGGISFETAYPVQRFESAPLTGKRVTIAGMGLVATDLVTALTVGRGGSFVDRGDRKRYLPSGREPHIRLYSRGGLPHCAKAVGATDVSDSYRLGIWTPAAIEGLRQRAGGGTQRANLDARRDILPLVYAEMQLRFYSHSASLNRGPTAAAEATDRLVRAWADGRFPDEIDRMAQDYGRFEPVEQFFPRPDLAFASAADYQGHVYAAVDADLTEALRPGGGSPVKAAAEVLRFLRDPMRAVIEFGGLTPESHVDFFANIRTRVTRVVAGPPALRSQQLLALMDAGVVETPFGPSPELSVDRTGAPALTSTHLTRPHRERAGLLVRGHLDDPTVHRSASDLLSRLNSSGRIQPFHHGGPILGGMALTQEFHPVNRGLQTERTIWVFGAVTEGIRYFTHYVPSPRSRMRAFLDAKACAEQIVG